MATRTPIATTVTLGRIYSGPEAEATNDWHLTISGYRELEVDDGIERVSMKDIHLNLSQVITDPAVQTAFPMIYDAVVRIMRGELVPTTIIPEPEPETVEMPTETVEGPTEP